MLIFYHPSLLFSNIADLRLLIHVFLLFPFCFNLVQSQEIGM
ncbi:unnamed protein product [Rodentolepis nana]|uniref:Uncharacterized protein n=1 Tax=Rodentolepis nana TaxID=102285 RepID=A0A0R3TPB3_RODNA|nr:unnamed protein product [Rodentolepis nana]